MPQTEFSAYLGRTIRPLLFIGCLLLILMALPAGVDAAPPVGAETCAECHAEETEAWQDSPHAHAVDENAGMLGATCEDCHGSYVEDHPEVDVMQLSVDSSACQDCHISTFQQWEQSIHAQNGVQCIGCHLSHSQEFRLSDEALCAACHRERLDTAHAQSNVSCIDCHLSSTNRHQEVELASAGEPSAGVPVASHDFTAVLSKDCMSCHGQDVHREDMAQVGYVSSIASPECQPELIAKLEATERTNKSLQTMTPVSLGVGMGIGGMLGIIFMLVLGCINQNRGQQ